MEQFLGLSRDASREKAESGTSPYNRNIVYDKQVGSITQENGFEFAHRIRGNIIGVYSTNTHIVYISYVVSTGNTVITYVDTNTDEIVEVVDTAYFGYELTRPIEIIAWYNYNQELLIMFSDGVFAKSSTPRLINLMDIGVALDNNKEFNTQRDADSTLLFSIISQPRFSVGYGNKSNHDADLVFFTIAYILPDGITRTRFIPTLVEGFPLYAFRSEYKKELLFKIEDLDPFFNQFVVGIIAYRDNGLFGYTTDPISYSTSTYEYSFNSVIGLNDTNVQEITVETSIFDKVKSLTIGNDTVILGGVTTSPSTSYQKYANNLKLNLYFDDRKNGRHQAPLLCPDEVYYFTIALTFKNRPTTEEYHIPNRWSTPSDLVLIDKVSMGLDELEGNNIPRFKIENSGNWVNPSVGLPNFNNLEDAQLNWGYWENEELYPMDSNYDGSIDYDGVTPIVGGRDLRGQPVMLHRVPGLDNLTKKFPMRLGMDIKNVEGNEYDMHTRLPAFSLNVDNFVEAFGSVIDRDNITGYRLSFVKKDGSSKLVEDINFIKPLVSNTEINIAGTPNNKVDYTINVINTSNSNNGNYESTKPAKFTQFGFSKLKTINLSLYKGGTTAQLVKANYGLLNNDTAYGSPGTLTNSTATSIYDKNYRDLDNNSDTTGTLGQYAKPLLLPVTDHNNLVFRIPLESQKYAVIKSIEQVPGNVKDKNNIFVHKQVKLKAFNSNTYFPVSMVPKPNFGWNPINYSPTSLDDITKTLSLDFYVPSSNSFVSKTLTADEVRRVNISSTLINLKDNVHQGLQPKEFVVIGATNIENPKLVFKDFGDTFSNNIFNELVEHFGKYKGSDYDSWLVTYFQQIYSGMLGIDNNTLIDFKKDKNLGTNYVIHTTLGANFIDLDKLVSFDYVKQETNKESTRQLNSLLGSIAFNRNKKYIDKFPFRITKSLTIQSENLSTLNVRTFLANAYYDMPSMRGEITSVTGFDRGVYCQQRYSLSIFQLKEKLSNNDDNSAYLAESDLFAYKPQPLIDEDNKGYIGSVHQFGRKLSKDGLLVVDAERGKVYIIGGNTPKDISNIKMSNYFRELFEGLVKIRVPNLFNNSAVQDNPYNGNGVLFGVDDKTNRILLTVNNYKALQTLPNNVTFVDGLPYLNVTLPLDIKNANYTSSNNVTMSFNLDWGKWIAEHDYQPQYFINTNKLNYAGINVFSDTIGQAAPNIEKSITYFTNKNYVKGGTYFYITDSTVYESYTDLLFNSRYDLTKWYKSVLWRTTVKTPDDKNIYEKSIDAIILYTDYQCSGRVELDKNTFSIIRNSEGIWNFNNFRDMVITDRDLPIEKDGSFDATKVYLDRTWFEKSDFISNFIIVRLIMNNIEDTQIHIHNVNVEARISDRI